MSKQLQGFKVGEQVRHFSGHVGTVTGIISSVVFIRFPDGRSARCDLDGYAIHKRLDGKDEQKVFRLTKLEKALK